MSKVATHMATIDCPSGLFNSKEETLLALESVLRQIERIGNNHNSNILAYGCTSESESETVISTSRGRKLQPGTQKTDSHFHVTAAIEKHSTIIKEIRKYLKTRFEVRFFIKQIKTHEHLCNRIHYCVTQGINYRKANTCSEDFAKRNLGDFVSLIEKEYRAIGERKRPFPEYTNLQLATDSSIYDFSNGKNKQHNEHQSAPEVSTNISDVDTLKRHNCEQENTHILPQKHGFCAQNHSKTDILESFAPYSEFDETTLSNCCGKDNINNNIY